MFLLTLVTAPMNPGQVATYIAPLAIEPAAMVALPLVITAGVLGVCALVASCGSRASVVRTPNA